MIIGSSQLSFGRVKSLARITQLVKGCSRTGAHSCGTPDCPLNSRACFDALESWRVPSTKTSKALLLEHSFKKLYNVNTRVSLLNSGVKQQWAEGTQDTDPTDYRPWTPAVFLPPLLAPSPGGSSLGPTLHEALSTSYSPHTGPSSSSPCPQKMDYFCASTVILHSIYLCCVR